MCLGIKAKREKIGNLLIYLSSEVSPLYHTKLLKLLYLIDQEAVKETGVPVTWLEYKAWKLGPVAPDIYNLKFFNSEFEEFVQTVSDSKGTRILPIADFDKGEFSEYEMGLIKKIIHQCQFKNGAEMVDLTHEPGGLWDKIAERHNLKNKFETDEIGISPYDIDLSELIESDPELLGIYKEARESVFFQAELNEVNAQNW